ncbi:MAG TPA: glycosyltransferase family 39 protein [Bryobacteraceae bacterium]
MAGVYAAVYPYFAWHDGVLQENAVLAFAVGVCIWLLLRVARSNPRVPWFAAGVALALTVLTKANLALFVPLALFWLGRPAMALRRAGTGVA